MKRSTAKPQKRDRALSCEKLIQAGVEVFSKAGFHGATTRQIAQRAKVNESLITRYFESKDGLFLAIVAKLVQTRRCQELSYPPQETLEKELNKYFSSRFDGEREHLDFFRISISQAVVDQKFAARLRKEIPFAPNPNFAERLTSLQNKRQMRADLDLARVHKMIESQLLGTFLFSFVVLGESEAQIKETLTDSARFWASALK